MASKRRRLLFDLETDGLLPELTKIHSLCLMDVDTGETWSCTDNWIEGDFVADDWEVRTDRLSIDAGLKLLSEAALIAGHNVINFDIPAIRKVKPDFTFAGTVRDTMLMAQVIWPGDKLKDEDMRRWKAGKFPGQFIGRYSLEAFGHRLGDYKGDYKGGWDAWSYDMQSYCEQDIAVTAKLWAALTAEEWPEESIDLEHSVAWIVQRQERRGFCFDSEGAQTLIGSLSNKRAEIEGKLQEFFPVLQVPYQFVPGRDNKTKGWTKGVPVTRYREEVFNPASRDHIARRLMAEGWEPEFFTDGGKPQVDEKVLNGVKHPAAKLLSEYLLLEKRIGQIYGGAEAWMNNVRDGRIHGRVTINGAVTGRMTHSKPNMAQVPASRSPYGHECRALFRASPGFKLVGADADALELRCLAHFMAHYDGGEYTRVVLEGRKEEGTDIHSVNCRALGMDPVKKYPVDGKLIPGRDIAKTWFYAFIYGAGDEKLGFILGKTGKKKPNKRGKLEDVDAKAAGRRSRASFLSALPALGKLTKAVSDKATATGLLTGLDKRRLFVRSAHSSLNTLLQSAGAIIMKRALVVLDRSLQGAGLVPGQDYEFVANVHDEWQIEVVPSHAEFVGQQAANAIFQAGEDYSFRCPLAGQFVVGDNWADTH